MSKIGSIDAGASMNLGEAAERAEMMMNTVKQTPVKEHDYINQANYSHAK